MTYVSDNYTSYSAPFPLTFHTKPCMLLDVHQCASPSTAETAMRIDHVHIVQLYI